MKRILVACTVAFLIAVSAFGQVLGELQWEEVTDVTILYDDPSRSLLIVESTVPNLSFDSNRGVNSAVEKEPNVWHVVLDPGPQVVTIRAEGYLPLALPARPAYQPRSARKIRVTPKPQFGASGGFDVNRPELTLRYSPAQPDEEVYVQLDDNPPQKMSFASGSVTLRPTSGQHTVRAYAGGRMWEATLSLQSGESYDEALQFSAGGGGGLEDVQPGNLFIESSPPGATVFLNQVEQQGHTPLTLNDLRPGTYEIEVVADLHLPTTQVVEVRELDYTNVDVELTPNFGRVQIDSEPSGALVYINDQQRGTTPLNIPRFNAGQYRVRLVQQLYYEETDTFSIEPGSGFEHTYDLRPQFGSLTVTSTPSGAEVEVDGARWGTTPVTREQVVSGTHLVRVSKENYYPQEKQVEILDGVHRDMPFQLSSSVGFITVDSNPSGAAVTVVETGNRLGTTPLREVALDPGTYTLRVELDKYETAERTLPVSLAGTPAIEVDLVRKAGHIRVESTPAKATVLLDGQQRGQTPTVIRDVPTGTYSLRIEKSGYDTQVLPVTVQHREMADLRITLGTAGTEAWRAKRNRARMLSFVPGGGQFASEGQWWRGVIYAGGIAAAGTMAYLANDQFSTAEEDYSSAMEGYHSSISQADIASHYQTAQAAYDDMDTAQQNLNLMLMAAGGIYAVSILDAWLFGGGPKPVATQTAAADDMFSPYASADAGKVQIGVRLQF